jgi:dephospho-CoA kinase
MIKFGLTGGIGAGKSMVSALFQQTGYPFFDADAVAKQLLDEETAVREAIIAHFGAELYADGRLNRTELAKRAFSSPENQAILNGIVHPAVENFFEAAFQKLESAGEQAVLVEASLLFEADTAHRYHHILVVTADEAIRLQRALRRGFQSEADIRRRMAMQLPEAEKCRQADDVIYNNGSLADLTESWKELWQKLCEKYQLPSYRTNV